MKITKPAPKCAECDHWKVFLRCTTLINGCGKPFCYTCWGPHSDKHQAEWAAMTDAEQERAIMNYDRGNAPEIQHP